MQSPTMTLRAHLNRADYDWFVTHPTAEWRKRHYVPGEDAGEYEKSPLACRFRVPSHTAVFLCPDGALRRLYFRAVDA